MTNEITGICGAIVLTFLLFVLRHLILPSERGNKRRYLAPTAHRDKYELNNQTVEDDSWLLWEPDVEPRAPRGQSHESRGKRTKVLRYDKRRDDRIMGDEIR